MKELNSFQLVTVPEGIEASVKSRVVTVKGSRGSLTKSFKHLAIDIYMTDKNTIKEQSSRHIECFVISLKQKMFWVLIEMRLIFNIRDHRFHGT